MSEVDLLRTPHKHGKLVIEPSYKRGTFDSHMVDCPCPFVHEGRFWMTYIGWDGIGYQTGLASSDDLLCWRKEGLALGRGPKGSVTEYNASMTCILRDNDLFGPGTLKRIEGCAAIKSVTMDVWGPCIAATEAAVPGADEKIAFDKFHVAQHLGEAVDHRNAGSRPMPLIFARKQQFVVNHRPERPARPISKRLPILRWSDNHMLGLMVQHQPALVDDGPPDATAPTMPTTCY